MNDTSAPVTRAQHLIPACVILALSISVAWLSFTREPSDPASHTDIKSWIKRLLVTSGFMAVIYALFTLLLKVQTPRGLFF